MTANDSSRQSFTRAFRGNRRALYVPPFLVMGFFVTLTFATASVAQEKTAHAEEASEQLWSGTMEIEKVRQFRFVLQLKKSDSAWSGVLESRDEGDQEFEMASVACTDSELRFELPQTAASYRGTWNNDTQSMVGKWTQRGQQLELAFRRVEKRPRREIKKIWKGTINALIQELDIAFVELESGQLIFDSISQKAGGFLAEDDSADGDVIYRVPAVRGTFKGKYSDDKSQIIGTWSQNFLQLELVLQTVDAEELKPKERLHPQTPRPPFPYASKDVSFPSKEKNVTLSGTLTIPSEEPVAAVVLISGSGPQDRDDSLLGHKPFWVIADHFARQGIATLRYDDRGVGESTGDFASATSFDFADDAEAAWDHLRSLPELEGVPVGLCGHSEGGIIAPIVAVRNEDIDFVVMMAGTGVSGEEIVYSQTKLILEAEGTAEPEIQKQARIQRALLSTVVQHADAPDDEFEAEVTQVLKQVLAEEEVEGNDLATLVEASLEKVSTPWFRTFLTLEPRDSLTKLRCPVLVIIGEKDLQVDPELNLPAIRDALREARNSDFEIVEYAGLNHLFQQCETGSVSEYEEIEETFNPKPLNKMTEWILSTATDN